MRSFPVQRGFLHERALRRIFNWFSIYIEHTEWLNHLAWRSSNNNDSPVTSGCVFYSLSLACFSVGSVGGSLTYALFMTCAVFTSNVWRHAFRNLFRNSCFSSESNPSFELTSRQRTRELCHKTRKSQQKVIARARFYQITVKRRASLMQNPVKTCGFTL